MLWYDKIGYNVNKKDQELGAGRHHHSALPLLQKWVIDIVIHTVANARDIHIIYQKKDLTTLSFKKKIPILLKSTVLPTQILNFFD